jgi:hypothetical protein
MLETEFRVEKSLKGYRVAMYRRGEPYVTFVDGLSYRAAEQEARSLRAFWERIRPHRGDASDFHGLKEAS